MVMIQKPAEREAQLLQSNSKELMERIADGETHLLPGHR